ncbi:hypothetical protein [Clostridium baratii]|uniref:hypothetical protein n=1 Tax=Clostridium baratii TaxID=1561 RepID=UPI0030CE6A63
MKIIYKNTLEDYNNFREFNLNKINSFKLYSLSSGICLLGAIYECINAYNYYLIGNSSYLDRSLKNILILTISAILLLIYLKKFLKLLSKLDFKLAEKTDKFLYTEKSLELNTNFISYKIAPGKINIISYDRIKNVVQNKDCIYILSKGLKSGYTDIPIIPLNIFSTKDEKKFINLIKNKTTII